jgi:hypothetical protein
MQDTMVSIGVPANRPLFLTLWLNAAQVLLGEHN